MCPVVTGIAGHDAIEVLGIALRLHEGLLAPSRTAREVRTPEWRTEEGVEDELGLHDGFVDGAMAPVHDRLGVTGREVRIISRMAGIRPERGVSRLQLRTHVRIGD